MEKTTPNLADIARPTPQPASSVQSRKSGTSQLVSTLEKIKLTKTETAILLSDRGEAYTKKRNYVKAIESLTEAIKIYGCVLDAIKPRQQLAKAFIKADDFKEAETELKLVESQLVAEDLASSEMMADTYHYFGLLRRAEGKHEDANTYFTEALRVYLNLDQDKNSAQTYHNQGLVLKQQNRHDEALAAFKQALNLLIGTEESSEIVENHVQCGLVHQAQQSYTSALGDFDAALTQLRLEQTDQDSEVGRVLGLISNVYLVQNNLDDALTSCTAALKEFSESEDHPDVANIKYCLGLIYEKQGNYQQADEQVQASLDIFRRLNVGEYHPLKMADILHKLSDLALKLDKKNAAIYYLESAVAKYQAQRIDETNPDSNYIRNRILEIEETLKSLTLFERDQTIVVNPIHNHPVDFNAKDSDGFDGSELSYDNMFDQEEKKDQAVSSENNQQSGFISKICNCFGLFKTRSPKPSTNPRVAPITLKA